jgi:hypothetical protein
MDERDRRGQLLLVAALGLAVAFVVLALVLNAVVFTENLATRNHGQTDSVVAYERAAEADVGGLLAGTNRHNNSDYDDLAATLTANVETWDANASVLAAGSGHVTRSAIASVANGTRVVQSVERNFSNATGVGDWTAATGIDGTRRFHVVAAPTDSADALTLTVSNGSAAWRVLVVENASNAGFTDVEVHDESGAVLAATTVESDAAALDLTEGTVNGSAVEGWQFAEGVGGGYDVRVENGSVATGRYVFVVDRERPDLLAALPSDTYHDPGTGDEPTTTPALYQATVNVTVQNSRVTYETNVAVAPESAPVPLVRVDDTA